MMVVAALVLASVAGPGCATRGFLPPTGPSAPASDAVGIWQQATAACRNISAFTAEIHISGRAGVDHRALPKATLISAFTSHDEIRIEASRFLVGSVLVLAGNADVATLRLPTEKRVVQARADEIVEALTGLRLTPRDLLAVLSGCLVPSLDAPRGERFSPDTIAVTLGATRAYLQRVDAVWRVVHGDRADMAVDYRASAGPWPSHVRVVSAAAASEPFDVNFDIDRVVIDPPSLSPAAFHLDAAGYAPMSLAELRAKVRGN